jgi:hypothetical protein
MVFFPLHNVVHHQPESKTSPPIYQKRECQGSKHPAITYADRKVQGGKTLAAMEGLKIANPCFLINVE